MLNNSFHSFFNGVGNSAFSELPTQTLPESQKKLPWIKTCLDVLENIGVRQLNRNIQFQDYYKMVNGDMVFSDYGLPDLSRDIVNLRNEIDLPTNIKHYDFLGILLNQITGDYVDVKDSFRVDTIDPLSQSEFSRDKQQQVSEYTNQMFNLELEQRLLAKGIVVDPNKQFNSEEEQQQYMQELEQQKAQLIAPEYMEKEMLKSWKTSTARWGQKTLDYDRSRFDMDSLNTQEITDYFLTGRWFRHYHVGYDHYKPENWSPMTTFFSEDVDAKYPQNGEFVGNIKFMSASDLINRYPDRIKPKDKQRLSGFYNQSREYGAGSSGSSFKDLISNNFSETHYTPFAGYYDYDMTLQMQELFDTPLGESIVVDENGNETKVPSWFPKLNNGGNNNVNRYAQELRQDIDVRSDLLQVTEAYWRSMKRVGILNFKDKDGLFDQMIVTDDILPEVLEEYGIKKLTNVTLRELALNPKENTIAYNYVPEVRWGAKVKSANSYLLEDLYIGGEALDFQIKGDSDVYDVKLPVVGFIGNSIAKKIRPYIIMYNICMNQIYNLLEKEIGTFLLFDVNFLPSEYKDNVSTKETLEMLREAAVEIGIVPVDTNKGNLAGAGQSLNTFMSQSVSFTEQMNSRMMLADRYKMLALEQIGMNQQRMGAPSKYTTAEGVQQGMTASYAQTDNIFATMSTSDRKASEVHLTVAQFCQRENKDPAFFYTSTDGDKAILENAQANDEGFHIRQFELVAINNQKDKKALQNLKETLLANNTQGSDLMDFAQISNSKTLSELVEYGKQNRRERDSQAQVQREHEDKMNQDNINAQKEAILSQREHETNLNREDNETKVDIAHITALGRAVDAKSDELGLDRIDKMSARAQDNEYKDKQLAQKDKDFDLKTANSQADRELGSAKLMLDLQKLREKQEDRKSKERIALVNKN